jgi:hypothetical protein
MTQLTKEQEAHLPAAIAETRRIGLRTGHDEECVREGEWAIKESRRLAKLEPAVEIRWARSTVEALYMAWDIHRAADPRLPEQPSPAQLQECWQQWCWGQTEQYWLGWYRFCIDVLKIDVPEEHKERLVVREALARSTYGVITVGTHEIAIQHPTRISFDEQERLHYEEGHAIEFADGFGVAFWHGTEVPVGWLRNKTTLDPRVVLKETNIERRRAGCEILTWARILEKLQPRVLDVDEDPTIGVLMEVDLPDAPNSRFLKVLCGTGRTFAIPVPNTCDTALAANAATYDIEPLDLRALEART